MGLGVRLHKLHREQHSVKTQFGEIQVKIGKLGSETIQSAPEYESCRQAAQKNGVSIRTVYAAAITAATQ
ncbi:MAG: DUF111 family protein [Pedosphaera sp.]|nr:DUF111 family protein [Pedosphaera sp.]